MKNLILISLFIPLVSSATKKQFSKDEIVFPKGKAEIEKFLGLLNDPENRKVAGIDNGKAVYKEIPQEGSAIFTLGNSDYMLYWDDFANDGSKEYLVIYITSGSGNYSGVQGAYKLEGGKLKSMKFDEIVSKSLFPGGDMSRFNTRLARPFAVRAKGKIYLRFVGNSPGTTDTYFWDKEKFSKQDL